MEKMGKMIYKDLSKEDKEFIAEILKVNITKINNAIRDYERGKTKNKNLILKTCDDVLDKKTKEIQEAIKNKKFISNT